ncbi:hypothetical protein D9M69_520460 [compost metagenome]
MGHAPGEQRGPRRRTQRGRVEAVEADPLGGEPVQAGRGNATPENVELTEADIVEQDHQHVGRAFRWPVEWRELRRVAVQLGAPDIPRKVIVRFRQRLGAGLECQRAKPQQQAKGVGFLRNEHASSCRSSPSLEAGATRCGSCCFCRTSPGATATGAAKNATPDPENHCPAEGFCSPVSAFLSARLW